MIFRLSWGVTYFVLLHTLFIYRAMLGLYTRTVKRSYCVCHSIAGVIVVVLQEVIILFQFDGWTSPCLLNPQIVMVCHCANSEDSFQTSTPRYLFCIRNPTYMCLFRKYGEKTELVSHWLCEIPHKFKLLVIYQAMYKDIRIKPLQLISFLPKQCWVG
jgi:hypothetical protein